MGPIGETHARLCYAERMDQFIPERYRLRRSERPSLLQHTLQAAPTEAMTILEEAVNWQEPVAVLTTYRMPSSEQRRGQLSYVHPLNAVLRTGRLDLFKRALELASIDREDRIYIEGEKDFSTPYDWVGCKVLSTAVCHGSLEHIQALLEAMKKNSLHMRTVSPHSDDNVWRDLAVYASQDKPASHWVSVLQVLDEQVRSDLGLRVRETPKRGKPPAPSKWTSMERDVRSRTHSMALDFAASQGNAVLVEALLSMGYATVTPDTLVNAWHSNGADIAVRLLTHPKRNWDSTAYRQVNLNDLAKAAAKNWGEWANAVPGQLSFAPFTAQDVALQRKASLDSLELFLAWVVEHKDNLAKLPQAKTGKPAPKWDSTELATPLKPVLMAMDETAFSRFSPLLQALGWPLPDWKDCEQFLDSPLTAYQAYQLDRLAQLDAQQASNFMAAMSNELQTQWQELDQLPTIKAVRHTLFELLSPSGMKGSPSKWLEEASTRFSNTLPEEALAVFRAEVLDEKLDGNVPSLPRPRL